MVIKRNKKNETIIFVNGCFDILHSAHVQLLEKAKALGSKLVVGLNSDRSVRALKGENRPIIDQKNRKYMLESLRCVDKVIIFHEKRITKIVRKVKPDFVVQGDDHTVEQIRNIDHLPSYIQIRTFCVKVPLSSKKFLSTSTIIEKIRES